MATESLTIGSWSSETPAWTVLDYTPLKEPADQRGADRLLPGTTGVKSYRRRNTITAKQIPMFIYGDTASDGSHPADAIAGLQNNIDAIINAIVVPTGTGDGTRSAVWHLPDGTTRSASLHVLGLSVARAAPMMARAILKLSIPSGQFA